MGIVPDAVSLSVEAGTPVGGEQALTRAGFAYQTERVDSGACWMTGLGGQREWNTNLVIGQSPNAGTTADLGSSVTLQIC